MKLILLSALLLGCDTNESEMHHGSQSKKMSVDTESIDHKTVIGRVEVRSTGRIPVVLSAVFGVCIDPDFGVNVNYDSSGDFTAGTVSIGSGALFRKIDYGIGTRFNKELPYRPVPMDAGMHKVFMVDEKQYGVSNVKVIGMGKVSELDIIFSYPIGDDVSLEHVKKIVATLVKCEVVRR